MKHKLEKEMAKEIVNKYVPSILTSPKFMLYANWSLHKRYIMLATELGKMTQTNERFRMQTRTNNWRKMHYLPMKRKRLA